MISKSNIKIWDLLNKKQKFYSIIMIFLMLIAMILETLSISIFIPVFQIIFEKKTDIKLFSYLVDYLKVDDLYLFAVLLLVIIFFIKNVYLIIFIYLKNILTSNFLFTLRSQLFKKYPNIFFLQPEHYPTFSENW